MTLSKAITIRFAAILTSLAERALVTPRSAKMMVRQTLGRGEVCDPTQVSGGRACCWQRVLMLFVRASGGFAVAKRASVPFLSTSKKG